jgi:hypothetical protein
MIIKRLFKLNNLQLLKSRFNFCSKKEDEFTNFGFKTVKKEDRQTLVNSVFANVAEK